MNQFEHNKVVGKRIARLRRKQNLSQKELALKAELSLFEIQHIEKGMISPTTEKLCLFSDIFTIKISDLMRVD